jgi:hypothetical protein
MILMEADSGAKHKRESGNCGSRWLRIPTKPNMIWEAELRSIEEEGGGVWAEHTALIHASRPLDW